MFCELEGDKDTLHILMMSQRTRRQMEIAVYCCIAIVAAAERGPEMTAALLAADVLLFLKELLCQTYCYH